MSSVTKKRLRIAMITRDEALTALAAAPPEGLTATEVFFAARPPAPAQQHADGGSSYAYRTLEALVEEGLAAICREDVRPRRFQAKARMPTPSDEVGLAVREDMNGATAPAVEQVSGNASASEYVLTKALPVSVVGAPERRRTFHAPNDGSDRIAEALMRMIQSPKPGSRAEIVKVQAAD